MNLDTLCSQLNATDEELAPLAVLSEEQRDRLSAQLASGKSIQHKHVSNAFSQAVEQLPRLMRKPILKMFKGLL